MYSKIDPKAFSVQFVKTFAIEAAKQFFHVVYLGLGSFTLKKRNDRVGN